MERMAYTHTHSLTETIFTSKQSRKTNSKSEHISIVHSCAGAGAYAVCSAYYMFAFQ